MSGLQTPIAPAARPKFCNDISHGGGSYLKRAFRCNHFTCGGIQAWRAHEEETRREVLSDLHRWENHYGLSLTPTGAPFGRFSFLGTAPLTDDRRRKSGRRKIGTRSAQRAAGSR